MREAGCLEVVISADSGTNEILESMEKNHTVEDVDICFEYSWKANLRIVSGYIIGWPGESTKTIDRCFAHMERNRLMNSVFFIGVRIYPGTKIARIAKNEGIIKTNADLLEPIFC